MRINSFPIQKFVTVLMALSMVTPIFAGYAAPRSIPKSLTEEQKIMHVLNRLGFGARPGDVEKVKAIGLQKYIDQQLDPKEIPDTVAESKVKGLDVFGMSTSELFAKYPNPGALLRQIEGTGNNAQPKANQPNAQTPADPADMTDADRKERRQKIAAIYQEPMVFPDLNVAENIFTLADFYLDLHAGGRTLFIQPSTHVVVSEGMAPELVRTNARLAEVFGVGITVQTTNMGDYRMPAAYTSVGGIPTLAAEMGMGGWVTGDSVKATREATHRFLKHTGVLPRIETVPGVPTRWTRINGAAAYVFAPCDGYFERRFELGDAIKTGQLAGMMHHLERPELEPEPVYFKSGGMLYAHGLVGHVRAGQNLAVLTQDISAP